MKAVNRGARLAVVDPRRTVSAQWADLWLGLDVGSDIALANAIGREIIASGLHNEAFIQHATTGFAEYEQCVQPYTLDYAQEVTGVPADTIRELAHTYARADRAQLCWTLGITEHHNAVDNVLALCNLALLTGHIGRYGSGLVPLRGQNNVQGGGDMGALPNRLPGGNDLENEQQRAPFERVYERLLSTKRGKNLTEMFDAMEEGELRALYVIGENPAQSEADTTRAVKLLSGLDHLVVQDIFLTATAELANVVFPAAASWCESEGTVTSSERRVQRVRKALNPPQGVRDDMELICEVARLMGHDWGHLTAEAVWDELRGLSDWHRGMSYSRLEELNGIHWPCPAEDHPGSQFLHGRLWSEPLEGPPAPFSVVEHEGPVEQLSEEYPIRLTTGRRLDSFNTGVQTGGYTSPLRRGESLDIHAEDGLRLGLADGEIVRVVSRRGAIEAPVRFDSTLRPGLAFMTLHFPDDVASNTITIDETDPRSGTAEFKAAAIRIEKLSTAPSQALI